MFRRLPSGLPEDPVYPADLNGLGYYIDEEKDEIRSIENPKAYFKFFLTKNERYNIVQREAMNEVIRNLVRTRLENLGLTTLNLPLDASASDPHLPIFVTKNLPTCSRVIVLFSESTQDLGVFAHRIIGGPGGINAGSAVNLVSYILSSAAQNKDEDVAIILANTGQLRWYRRGQKAVSQTTWWALPQASAVSDPIRFDKIKNTIPGNRSTEEHVNYIFNEVIAKLVNEKAKIDVIGVSEGAYQVSRFLDGERNWIRWGESGRLQAFASVASYWQEGDFMNPWFKAWFEKRGRAYLTSTTPPNTFVSPPNGCNKVAAYGCNAYSLGEPYYSECMLPKGYNYVVDWLSEVAEKDCAGGEGYCNAILEVEEDEEEEEEGWKKEGEGEVEEDKGVTESVSEAEKERGSAGDESGREVQIGIKSAP